MKKPEDINILVVDDEDDLRKSLRRHFEIDGYNVFTASGGHEALEIVMSKRIDFVMSDVRMPKGDGEELLERIRQANPELPVILLVTGYAELTRDEALKKGAVDLLPKPINLDTVEAIVNKFLLGT